MDSLLNTLQSQIGRDAIDRIGRQLGTDEQTTNQAVGAALPLLIDALGRNASTAEGAEALTNAVRRDHDGSRAHNILDYLSGGGDQQEGSSILGHILGGKRSVVETGLSRAAGMDRGNAGQLLTMLAPLVLSQLGGMQRQRNMGAGDIADMLRGDRQRAESELGGMSRLLDLDGDGDITDDMLNMGGRLLGGFLGGRR